MRNFKKILFLALCLALMLTFIACGDDESGQSSSVSESGKNENAVTVKFDTQGGTQIDNAVIEKGEKVSKPNDPEKVGYTFDGWYADGEKWSFDDNIVSTNTTITAKWTPIEYTLTFDSADISPITYTAEDTVSLPNITAPSGCAFVGWFEDEELTKPIPKIEKGSYGNKTLYAKNVPLIFVLKEDTYALNRCDYSAITASIPSTYNGKSVTSIDEQAFNGCKNLTSVTIPDSVAVIGQWAFINCISLTSIDIPSGVKVIAQNTFRGCSKLESVTIPNTMTSLSHFAFSGCSSLKSVTIPSSVTEIGWGAFGFCSSLESIIIPSNVTEMGKDVFYGCKNLKIFCEATIEPSEWVLSWNPDNLPVYWYSEIKPVTSGGNYWHYGTNGEIVVWE